MYHLYQYINHLHLIQLLKNTMCLCMHINLVQTFMYSVIVQKNNTYEGVTSENMNKKTYFLLYIKMNY